ncbi:HEPN domain-containing protein [Nocardia sp. NPDC051911]|uniref:HEPN domain-containing protein n=1 Tax=Nocardia sp. NPDC051911 TaxID=3154648 RepID=UPI00342350C5
MTDVTMAGSLKGPDDESEGMFWHPETPFRKARGRLFLIRSQKPDLRLSSPIVTKPEITDSSEHYESVAASRFIKEDVAAYQPMTLHGELEDGTAVTALYAQGGSDPAFEFVEQRYGCRFVILGAHLPGPKQLYDNMRFQMRGIPYAAQTDLADTVPENSCLVVDIDEDTAWLRYQPQRPGVLQEVVNAGVSGCLSLAALATRVQPSVVRAQVRPEGSDVWVDVVSARLRETLSWKASQLLPWSEVTVARLARWIPISESFDGLEWGVISPPNGAVQVQLLTAASIVEGLHRRTNDRNQLSLSGKARERVIAAAKDAGRAALQKEGVEDPEAGRRILGEALGHFHELTFAQRAREFVALAEEVLPELFVSLPGYADHLVRARNQLAHHLPLKAAEQRETRILRWAAISLSVPWLLRIVLLDKAGFPRDLIRNSFLSNEDFQSHLVNTAQIARDADWTPL